MIPKECKRLAEVDFPIAAVSAHSAREKSICHRRAHTSAKEDPMTYSLYGEDDWVGPLASIGGWHDVVEVVAKERSSLKGFVDEGYTENPAQLRADIAAFLRAHPRLRDDVHSTLANLGKTLKKTKLIAIVSDSLIEESSRKKDRRKAKPKSRRRKQP